jgi:uncharacterized protein YuzE
MDAEADILAIRLRENAIVEESEEVEPGVIFDYDAAGEIVGLDIQNISRRIAPPRALVDALEQIASMEAPTDSAPHIARAALLQASGQRS